MGFASPIASHQWRIIGWFTGSRAGAGSESTALRTSACSLASSAAFGDSLISGSVLGQAEDGLGDDVLRDVGSAAADHGRGPVELLDLPGAAVDGLVGAGRVQAALGEQLDAELGHLDQQVAQV